MDFILGEGEIALEIKSSAEVKSRHQKGLKAFKEEFSPKQAIIVSLDPQPRKTEDNILILPWKEFLRRLWGNELL